MTHCRHQEDRRAQDGPSPSRRSRTTCRRSAPAAPTRRSSTRCTSTTTARSVPISQVANVTLLDARTISVQPWEKGMGAKIEKAIRETDLGLNPASQGDLLRVPMPALTEERRKELTKVVRHEGEEAKIAVRNLRRDANEHAEEAAEGQADHRRRRAPRARRDAEAHRPHDRRDRPAGHRPRKPRSWRSDGHRCRRRSTSMTTATSRPIPRHVAIVMDGNGRWAKRRFMPRFFGHKQGVDALVRMRAGLRRPRHRVPDGVRVLVRELEAPDRGGLGPDGPGAGGGVEVPRQAGREGVRIRIVGDRSAVSDKVRAGLGRRPRRRPRTTRASRCRSRFNYGGRWDIVQACRQRDRRGRAARGARRGSARRAHGAELCARPRPVHPHRRRSAHQQLPALAGGLLRAVFTDCLWPEFGDAELDAALADYARPRAPLRRRAEPTGAAADRADG